MAKKSSESNEITLKLSEAGDLLRRIGLYNSDLADHPRRWEEPVVPYLQSPPGTGKTSLCWQVAADLGYEFRGFIGAQYDPAEMAGFIFFDKDTRETWRAKPDFLPAEGRWLLLCDEFAQMTMMQKNIMAQLIQERRLGEHKLSPYATLVLAGNRARDRAGVQPDPSHVLDRVFIIYVQADREEWEKWALSHGIRQELISWIRMRPEHFDLFDPELIKSCTPRGLVKVSVFLDMNLPSNVELAAIQGQIGSGPAADFVGFLRVYRDLPDIDGIINNPKKAMVPDVRKQPDVVYAVCGALSSRATNDNISKIIEYGKRLPPEFCTMMMKDIFQRDSSLMLNKMAGQWMAGEARDLLV